MGDIPMEEEDDSFNMPPPCMRITVQPSVQQQKSEDPIDPDPDSDDSFEAFTPTQTTSGSVKSSASSGTTNEKKASTSVRPSFPNPNIQKVVPKPSSFLPFTHQSTQRTCGFPPRPLQTQNTQNKAVHVAVKNAIDSELKSTTSSPFSPATPSSPNSLARHRSVNSGLRHSSTPPVRPLNTLLNSRTTSPSDSRPATLTGELKMVRDQLESERRKFSRLHAEFQKDKANSLLLHKAALESKDQQIQKQLMEIEVLKTSSACRKTESPAVIRVPVMQATTAVPSIPTTSSVEVRKVYPKIPETGGGLRKTPRRTTRIAEPVSAFRHSNRDEDDDTFVLDDSFEPSATSTPKLPGVRGFQRSSLRRPLNVKGDSLSECARGAPLAKRARVVFPVERKRRTRKELQDEMQKIWEKIDKETSVSKGEEPKKADDPMETEDDEMERVDDWLDEYLLRQLKQMELQKIERPKKNRAKLLQKSEQEKTPDLRCASCGIDDRAVEETGEPPKEKRWETVEGLRVEIGTRRARQQRAQHYRDMLNNVHRKGIEELAVVGDQKKTAEDQFQKAIEMIGKRTLEELREERKDQWRQSMMGELREKGEADAVLRGRKETGNEESIWTSDDDESDSDFPTPFNYKKWELCSDCAHYQQVHRRTTRKSRVRIKLQEECMKQYSEEKCEELRNVSVLTKSKIEAADRELQRHVDEILGSRRIDNDEDDIF